METNYDLAKGIQTMFIWDLKNYKRDLEDQLNGILAGVHAGTEGEIEQKLEIVHKELTGRNNWLPHD
tara:strand:+ start:3976 stop:4176 length:201 start_codon:yes stop_codon:yes gene_type:complete